MDLLVIQLKGAIRRILETKGVRARVLDKVNRYGEVVIGVILERPVPPPRVLATEPASTALDEAAPAGPAASVASVAPAAPVAPVAPVAPAAASDGSAAEEGRACDGEDVAT